MAKGSHAAVLYLLAVQLLINAGIVSAGLDQSLFKPMIVLVGDSITERGFDEGGWGLDVTEAYERKADVLNRGFGGYNSRMGVYVLDEFLNSFGAQRIKLVTIGFGSNDAQAPNTPTVGFLHVPVEEYRANLIAMVKKLRSKGVTNILIITPPPTNKEAGSPQRSWAARRDTRPYAAAAVAVAKEQGLPFVNLQAAFYSVQNWQDLAVKPDGIHLTPAGNRVVYGAVMNVINTQLKPVSPQALPWHMPDYRKINRQLPAETFDGLYGYRINTGVQLPTQTTTPAPPAAAAAAPAGPKTAAATAVVQNNTVRVRSVADKAPEAAAEAAKKQRQTPRCKGKAPAAALKDKAGRQWGFENGESCLYSAAAAAAAPQAAAKVVAVAAAAAPAVGSTGVATPTAIVPAATAPAPAAAIQTKEQGKLAPAAAAKRKQTAAVAAAAAGGAGNKQQSPFCKGRVPAKAPRDKSGRVWGFENGVSCVYVSTTVQKQAQQGR